MRTCSEFLRLPIFRYGDKAERLYNIFVQCRPEPPRDRSMIDTIANATGGAFLMPALVDFLREQDKHNLADRFAGCLGSIICASCPCESCQEEFADEWPNFYEGMSFLIGGAPNYPPPKRSPPLILEIV